MSDPSPTPGEATGAGALERRTASGRLADGQWHRLHPATPLLRGGIAFVAILGIIVVNLRDVVISIVIGSPEEGPLTFIIERGLLPTAIVVVIVVLLLAIGAFALSWRMHSFRITDDGVEVRSGILLRTHRQGRLDRIQGINIARPLLARLVGTARLEISVAGEDASIPLAYLGSAAADELRREILALASGARATPGEHASAAPTGGILERRVNELLAPELDPHAVAAQSIVTLDLGRLIGSLALSGLTVFVLIAVPVAIVATALWRQPFVLFGIVPAGIAVGGYYLSRFAKSLRYSIASTPDGVRVGYGLLSIRNETLPPGRIHALQVSQPMLWRIPGWWEIKFNRAGSLTAAASGSANTTLLPVGSIEEVQRVLELVLPQLAADEVRDLVRRGLTSPGGDAGFANVPPRARLFNWFAWRRTGLALAGDVVLLRHGRVRRDLQLVPAARVQSIAVQQGPFARALRLAQLRVHTVAGPISPRLAGMDADDAMRTFSDLADTAVAAAAEDRSHRWRGDTTAP